MRRRNLRRQWRHTARSLSTTWTGLVGLGLIALGTLVIVISALTR